jgi:hypothetical protein
MANAWDSSQTACLSALVCLKVARRREHEIRNRRCIRATGCIDESVGGGGVRTRVEVIVTGGAGTANLTAKLGKVSTQAQNFARRCGLTI